MRAKLGIVLVVLVLMVSGVPIQRHIICERQNHRLRAGLEGLNPDEIFTTMCLAGLRGVAVDYLWVKALTLQQEGRWHEVAALADLIAKLQPHFPTVWEFNSWNLAYNISVQWVDPADQWKWVKEGLIYLDQGLERNPLAIQILFQKGWTYWHKVNLGPSEGPEEYFRDRLREDRELNPRGLSSYQLAAQWFLLAQRLARQGDPESQHPFLAQAQVEAMYYRALWAQAKELLEAGDLEGAEKLLLRVKDELEVLRQRHGAFAALDTFEKDYREVLQVLHQVRIYREIQAGT